ncbi:MAG TPA: uroporphyrinogen-III synthase [Acidobacteriaceae bacterium]|jgi:uroporphyrinogen-III synthase|nr:uroporphyrinogen-III synthase [Acidobacteriaceae bacterium]
MREKPAEAKAPLSSGGGTARVNSCPDTKTESRDEDRLPLAGRRILVTRARHQAGQLSEKLRALGASVVEIPAIEIVAPESFAELDGALGNLSQYGWLIVTSANGVAALAGRMGELGIVADVFGGLKIAAVGSATAQALEDLGLTVAVTPAEYVAESLVSALESDMRGQRVLLVRATVARDVIPDALRGRGATVDVVDAYRTVIPAESVTAICTIFGDGGKVPDAATFTSSSTVTNFLNLAQAAGVEVPKAMRAVSIGPITSRTLRDNGWEPAAEADPHDLGGLVAAVVRALG